MSISPVYQQQVGLLLDVLPYIKERTCFAIKGGTAINLFLRDMPRLSVDIDLTYLPIEPRHVFLENLTKVMEQLALELQRKGYIVTKQRLKQTDQLIKLIVANNQATIKIEPNVVLRGTVFSPTVRTLVPKAQEIFLQSQKALIVSEADLYAGKICAALDRQHPRDLFDIKLLFESGGITNEIRQAFVVYLASGPRPMHELLQPNKLDLKNVYKKEFVGMTELSVNHSELLEIREKLISTIQADLTVNERHFLLSIKQGDPDWALMPFSEIKNLPALKWKIINIRKMEKKAHKQAHLHLKNVLER